MQSPDGNKYGAHRIDLDSEIAGMYDLSPPGVYVHETVMSDERLRPRAERVIAALKDPVEPVVYRDEDVPDMILNRGVTAKRRHMGTLPEVRDPILVFNTFRFDGRMSERLEWVKEQGVQSTNGVKDLLGYGAFNWAKYNLKGDPNRHDKVCRPCWRIHLQNGCVHRCAYCGLGGLLVAMVNVEEYCRHLGDIIERHPWQQTYLLDDDGDPPCLEPEHGCLGCLIEYFGTLDSRYVVIHTKTWNTEWMRDLRHKGNTIIVWSISGPTQSRLIEPVAGTTEQRIEAARIAQEAGYQIRYKFKPIIPVLGWRDDAARAVQMVFERTKPDIISLCVFMWMDVDEMTRRIGADLLDPDCLRAAREERDAVENTTAKPFPPRIRAEIYEHYLREIRKWDSDIPVSLSTENFSMWKTLGPALGATATNYVCGCGPQSVPGARKLACHPFRVAVRHDEGIAGTYG